MSDDRDTTVVAVFETRHSAVRAVEALRELGFEDDRLGMVARQAEDAQWGDPQPHEVVHAKDTMWEERAAAGLVAGGTAGSFVGVAMATGLIPGVGPAIGAGILASLLASATAGAAAGGLLGGLIGMGVPEEDARYFQTHFESGKAIVTVRAGDRFAEAVTALKRHNAIDVSVPREPAMAGAGM